MGIISLISGVLMGCMSSKNPQNKSIIEGKTSIHQFDFTDIYGKSRSFSEFKGKKILIVNTASKCGFSPQLEDLEKLHNQYQDKLAIIAFPSNNFGNQEPLNNSEIENFCKKNYGVSFTIAAKSNVKGKEISAVMEWLISSSNKGNILWNFEKFLLNEDGKLIKRFRSYINPLNKKITASI